MNQQRTIIKIIHEICEEHQFRLATFSNGWIMLLASGQDTSGSNAGSDRVPGATGAGQRILIYGNYFSVNSEAVGRICSDKAALSDLLEFYHIPHVPHTYYPAPANEKLGHDPAGSWSSMLALLERYGRLVVKNNTGTGGMDVFQVSNAHELEKAVFTIYQHGENVAVSPWIDIAEEYRVIIVHQQIALVYRKIRPYVIGDGRHTVCELAAMQANTQTHHVTAGSTLPANLETEAYTIDSPNDLINGYIPDPGRTVYLSWKHNLGQGASSEIVYIAPLLLQSIQGAGEEGGCSFSDSHLDKHAGLHAAPSAPQDGYIKMPDASRNDYRRMPDMSRRDYGKMPGLAAISELALACARRLDLQFASVDIIRPAPASPATNESAPAEHIGDMNRPMVLEINSGVMMDNFADESPFQYQLAKSIYQKVILGELAI